MSELTYEEISKLLRYEADTGKLFWRPRTPDMFISGRTSAESQCRAWNSRHAGKEALTSLSYGYFAGDICNRKYLAHRVSWLLVTGGWPVDTIDHINGIRTDNRIENLRAVSNAENHKNQKRPRSNASGVVGVSFFRRVGGWQASIMVSGRTIHLGTFVEFERAVAARKAAEIEYGFHPNHGRVGR